MCGAPYPFLLLPNGPRDLQVVNLPVPRVLPRLPCAIEANHRPSSEANVGPIFKMGLRGDGELRPLDASTIANGNGDEPVVTRECHRLAYASCNIPVNHSVVDFDVHEDTGDIVHHDDSRRGDPRVLVRAPINHRGLTENDRRPGRRDARGRDEGEKDEKDQSGGGHNASNGKGDYLCFLFTLYHTYYPFVNTDCCPLRGSKRVLK